MSECRQPHVRPYSFPTLFFIALFSSSFPSTTGSVQDNCGQIQSLPALTATHPPLFSRVSFPFIELHFSVTNNFSYNFSTFFHTFGAALIRTFVRSGHHSHQPRRLSETQDIFMIPPRSLRKATKLESSLFFPFFFLSHGILSLFPARHLCLWNCQRFCQQHISIDTTLSLFLVAPLSLLFFPLFNIVPPPSTRGKSWKY